jgi:hypothetical protein
MIVVMRRLLAAVNVKGDQGDEVARGEELDGGVDLPGALQDGVVALVADAGAVEKGEHAKQLVGGPAGLGDQRDLVLGDVAHGREHGQRRALEPKIPARLDRGAGERLPEPLALLLAQKGRCAVGGGAGPLGAGLRGAPRALPVLSPPLGRLAPGTLLRVVLARAREKRPRFATTAVLAAAAAAAAAAAIAAAVVEILAPAQAVLGDHVCERPGLPFPVHLPAASWLAVVRVPLRLAVMTSPRGAPRITCHLPCCVVCGACRFACRIACRLTCHPTCRVSRRSPVIVPRELPFYAMLHDGVLPRVPVPAAVVMLGRRRPPSRRLPSR